MWCTFVAVIFHVPLNYFLVVFMGLGVPGVAMASVLTNLHMMLLLMAYVYSYGRWEWKLKEGIGGVCGGLGPLLKFAVPSCIGICLEWWWYEIVTVLAGYLPNPQLAVAATGILIQTTSLMYTVPMALAGCVSARGLIEEEKIDSFNAPYYAPSAQEVKSVVEEEGSSTINCLEAFEVEWDGGAPSNNNFQKYNNEIENYNLSRGQQVAKIIRAVVESMLEVHFGRETMDELFKRYAEMVGDYFSRTAAKYIDLVISLTKEG